MRTPIPVRFLLLAIVCLAAAACGGSGDDTSGAAAATTAAAASGTTAAASRLRRRGRPEGVGGRARRARPARGRQGRDPGRSGEGLNQPGGAQTSAKSQWSSQLTELDSAVDALKTTIAGISGDSLASALPTVVSDLQQLDIAWTALLQQVDQDCG